MSKLCLVVLMVFTQLLDITRSDYASKYYNQVIYIETLTQRGHWLDAYHNGGARFTGSSQRDVINAVWAKWFVRPDPDGSGKIALESALYPNHYLDSHGGMSALVTHADYPYDKTWALWTLEDSPTGSFQVLHSVQNVDYYLTWFFGGGWVATYDDSAKLRVYQPTITESTAHVYTYNNSQGVDPVHTTFKEKVGVSDTTSTTTSVTVELSTEILMAFTASMSVSTTWSQTESTTWSKEVEREVKVKVSPGYTKIIEQLRGSYGQFSVYSTVLFFKDIHG